VRKLGPPSRGPPIVVVQDATEPFSALNRSIHSGAAGQLLDQLVVETLVIALQVVVLRVFLDGLAKVALAQWDDVRDSVLRRPIETTSVFRATAKYSSDN
jgi:hypothetical protein